MTLKGSRWLIGANESANDKTKSRFSIVAIGAADCMQFYIWTQVLLHPFCVLAKIDV